MADATITQILGASPTRVTPTQWTRERVLALLDLDMFKQWLQAVPAETVVGSCAMPGACPLRNYLSAQGVPAPTVCGSTVDWQLDYHAPTCWPNFSYGTAVLPDWARMFVKGVDYLHVSSKDPHPQVTAADALAVLDAISCPTRLAAA